MIDTRYLTQEELMARVQKLEEALLPFANAYERMQHFEPLANSSPIYVEANSGTLYELFADDGEDKGKDPNELLKVGHLETASNILRERVL